MQLAGASESGDTPSPRDRFRALYESTFAEIDAFVARRHRAGFEIDDVVAETYLSAWRRIDDVPVNWLDPTSSPKVVDALPPSVQQQGGPAVTATGWIYGIQRPGVTMTQLLSFVARLRTLPGRPMAGFAGPGSPGTHGFDVTMHGGDDSDLQRVLTVMETSGLFVDVHQG